MILEQVYPLKKHLGRVCKYRHSLCPRESTCLKPVWFLHLQGVECCNPGLLPSSPYQPWIKGPLQLAVRWKKKWHRKETLHRSTKDTCSIYFPVFMVWGAAKMQTYTLFCVVTCNFGKKSAAKDADFVFTKQSLCLVTILFYLVLFMSLKDNIFFHS